MGKVVLSSSPEEEYGSIADAVAAAQPGDTVLLGGGEYGEQILLHKPIKIAASVDAAEGQCVIRWSGASPALVCSSPDTVCEGIDVYHDGCGDRDCAEVSEGAFCSFRRVALRSSTGSGLALSGGGAKLDSCRLVESAKHGVIVREGGSLSMRDTLVKDNGAAGVVSRGKGSKVELQECVVESNGGNGVGMDEGGQATLVSTRVLGNKGCGAMTSGLNGKVEASACTFTKNGTHGVACAGRAVLATRECTFKANKQLGVLVQSGARAEMQGDDVSRNGAHGLCMQLGGVLASKGCRCRDNKMSGVALLGVGSVGHVTGLNATNNGVDGVHVGQGASLKLLDSTVEGSKRMGLSMSGDGTKAHVSRVCVTESGEYGVMQASGAEVICEECNVHSNTQGDVSGVVLSDGAHGGSVPPPAAPAGGGSGHGGTPHIANIRKQMDKRTPLIGSKLGRPRAGIRAMIGVLFCSVFLLGWWIDSLLWSTPGALPNPSRDITTSSGYFNKPPPSYWGGNRQRWDSEDSPGDR